MTPSSAPLLGSALGATPQRPLGAADLGAPPRADARRGLVAAVGGRTATNRSTSRTIDPAPPPGSSELLRWIRTRGGWASGLRSESRSGAHPGWGEHLLTHGRAPSVDATDATAGVNRARLPERRVDERAPEEDPCPPSPPTAGTTRARPRDRTARGRRSSIARRRPAPGFSRC